MKEKGIVLISHTAELAHGIYRLISEIAPNVSITYAGGLEDGSIGTSYENVLAALEKNEASEILCFYDLGSTKMTMELIMDDFDKNVTIYDTAFVESAYTAATLIEADFEDSMIIEQLNNLKIK